MSNNLNVVQSGDLLTWRQYQDGVGVGGIRLGLTNGNGSAGVLQAEDGQLADRDTVTGSWQMRAASLSAYQGLPISSVILGNVEGGTPGNWDIYLGDITLVHPDGTILPIYSRTLSGFSFIFKGPAESNVSVITEKVAATPNELNTTFYSGDQIGSTTILTDGAGWPVSSDIYYPFGQEATPTADNNHYKFTGQERDSEANLDYFNARHYSFAAGRFMSPDPYDGSMNLGYPQTLNRYAYVGNNPLGYTDPTGLVTVPPCTDCGGGGVGIGPIIGTLGAIWVVDEIINLFSHPTFHGSKLPRPPWDPHNAHLGLPNIAAALDLPDTSCEFGACGFQQSGNVPNVSVNCRGIETDHLGLILAQHCDATVSIGDGWLYSLSAGPIGDRLRGFVTKTHTLPTGATDFWKGRDGLGLAQCLIGAASASQASSDAPQYHPVTGPNSNIWLNGIFSSCGVNLGIKTHGPYF